MNSSTPVPAARTAVPVAAQESWLRSAGTVLAGSAFIAACAHVALPLYFTPVPLTLQPFAVLTLGLLLSPRLAAAATVAYLGEGAVGLPVFAPGIAGTLGLAHLLGPTGGYLLSYPFAATLISSLWRSSRRGLFSAMLSAAAGNALILCTGAVWLGIFTHASLQLVITQAILPFVPGDALKVVAAGALATGWQRLRHRNLSSFPTK
jgi:biotin transport system substrate-specific component